VEATKVTIGTTQNAKSHQARPLSNSLSDWICVAARPTDECPLARELWIRSHLSVLMLSPLVLLPTFSVETKADQLQNSPADAEHEDHAHFDESEPREIHVDTHACESGTTARGSEPAAVELRAPFKLIEKIDDPDHPALQTAQRPAPSSAVRLPRDRSDRVYEMLRFRKRG
jgi:hypothetical protein